METNFSPEVMPLSSQYDSLRKSVYLLASSIFVNKQEPTRLPGMALPQQEVDFSSATSVLFDKWFLNIDYDSPKQIRLWSKLIREEHDKLENNIHSRYPKGYRDVIIYKCLHDKLLELEEIERLMSSPVH